MSASDNRRRNATGNVEDDAGGRYYVRDEEGEYIAGPFGVASYAYTVRERMAGQGYREPLDVVYLPPTEPEP